VVVSVGTTNFIQCCRQYHPFIRSLLGALVELIRMKVVEQPQTGIFHQSLTYDDRTNRSTGTLRHLPRNGDPPVATVPPLARHNNNARIVITMNIIMTMITLSLVREVGE
jgi:hypothetical protein